MLAARDQENLVHGHQQAAASKPLNQGARQLQPKTPGNKAPKTPFRVPLNDENGPGAFGGGKTGLKPAGKGNENFTINGKQGGLGDKDAFKTPMGPRNRAPLGLKTTNAKTKAFHIPPPPSVQDVPEKPPEKSASARRSKQRVSHAEMTKLDVLPDWDTIRESEPEYMPPPVKYPPYYPDDIHESNLTPYPNGIPFSVVAEEVRNAPGPDGLSHAEREELQRKKDEELYDKELMAQMVMDTEISMATCPHDDECQPGTCSYTLEAKKKAEAKFQKVLEELYPHRKPRSVKTASTEPSTTGKAAAPTTTKKSIPSKTPSTLTSKSAATALSQPCISKAPKSATAKAPLPTTKPRIPFSNISSRKQTPAPPTNPSTMRHSAATLASKTTIGRTAGRSVSANLRKPSTSTSSKAGGKSAPEKTPDTSLPPAQYIKRYGEPKWGSEMWVKCRDAGCFEDDLGYGRGYGDEDEDGRGDDILEELFREDAQREFVLEF